MSRCGLNSESCKNGLSDAVSNDFVETMVATYTDTMPNLAGVPHSKISVGDMVFDLPGAQDVSYYVRIIESMISKIGRANI